MPSDLERISGLWIKENADGKFFSGKTDKDIPAGARLLIFRNTKKTQENQPDFQLYVAPDRQQEERRGEY